MGPPTGMVRPKITGIIPVHHCRKRDIESNPKSKSGKAYLDYSTINQGKHFLPDDKLNISELMKANYQTIEQLSPRRKEKFPLCPEQAISNEAIAKKMNVSVKTIENQMTSA